MKYLDITRRSNNAGSKKHNTNPAKKSSVYMFIIFVLVLGLFCLSNSLFTSSTDNHEKSSSDYSVLKSEKDTNDSNILDQSLPDTTNTLNSDKEEFNSFSSNENNIEKTKLSIKVLNGSGKQGTASLTKDTLENAGFIVNEIGNFDQVQNRTIIYYNEDKHESAVLIQSVFDNNDTTILLDSAFCNTYDIVVVVGKNY